MSCPGSFVQDSCLPLCGRRHVAVEGLRELLGPSSFLLLLLVTRSPCNFCLFTGSLHLLPQGPAGAQALGPRSAITTKTSICFKSLLSVPIKAPCEWVLSINTPSMLPFPRCYLHIIDFLPLRNLSFPISLYHYFHCPHLLCPLSWPPFFPFNSTSSYSPMGSNNFQVPVGILKPPLQVRHCWSFWGTTFFSFSSHLGPFLFILLSTILRSFSQFPHSLSPQALWMECFLLAYRIILPSHFPLLASGLRKYVTFPKGPFLITPPTKTTLMALIVSAHSLLSHSLQYPGVTLYLFSPWGWKQAQL